MKDSKEMIDQEYITYYNKGNDLLNEAQSKGLTTLSHERLELYLQAIDCYDQAIKLNPKHAVSYWNKHIVLRDLSWLEQNLVSYRADTELYQNGTTHFYQSQYYERKAQELDPIKFPPPSNCCHILAIYDIEYDNPILKHPDILQALSSNLNLTCNEVINRISVYDNEFVEQVCLSGYVDLFGDLS